MNILEQIEKIVKEADTYLTEHEILRELNIKRLNHCSLGIYMDFLESIGKIIIETTKQGNEVYWVGVDNPKLEKLLSESVVIK